MTVFDCVWVVTPFDVLMSKSGTDEETCIAPAMTVSIDVCCFIPTAPCDVTALPPNFQT